MIITKSIEIDMGHRVPNHKSKCKNLHGHRYRIEVGVDGEVISEKGSSKEGMVIDFGDLKEIMLDSINKVFDHSLIVYGEDEFKILFEELRKRGQKINFVPFIPTAENIAKHFYDIMKESLEKVSIKIKFVKVFETPTSMAQYSEEIT